jgi:hypothetical protein
VLQTLSNHSPVHIHADHPVISVAESAAGGCVHMLGTLMMMLDNLQHVLTMLCLPGQVNHPGG